MEYFLVCAFTWSSGFTFAEDHDGCCTALPQGKQFIAENIPDDVKESSRTENYANEVKILKIAVSFT